MQLDNEPATQANGMDSHQDPVPSSSASQGAFPLGEPGVSGKEPRKENVPYLWMGTPVRDLGQPG